MNRKFFSFFARRWADQHRDPPTCAHHARIIDREIVQTPQYARTVRGNAWHREWPDSRKVYTILTIVAVILETIPSGSDWKRRAVALLKNPTGVSFDEMGIHETWDDEPLWKRP